jgi:hypothetical protein
LLICTFVAVDDGSIIRRLLPDLELYPHAVFFPPYLLLLEVLAWQHKPVLSECGFCLLLGFDVVKLWCSRVGDGNCPIINEKKKKVLASKLKDVVKEDQNKLTACW